MLANRLISAVIAIMICLFSVSCASNAENEQLNDHSYLDGYYLKCDNGTNMIIVDAKGANPSYPCKMSAADDSFSFDELTDGDRIQIEIHLIMESYPAQTTVYSVKKLSDGARDDIDIAILERLAEQGWIEPITIPSATLAYRSVDALPYSEDSARMSASPIGSNPTFYFFGESLTFYCYEHHSNAYYQYTLDLPKGYTNGKILYAHAGGGSGELDVTLEAVHNNETVYLGCIVFADFFVSSPQSVSLTKLTQEQLSDLRERVK